MQQEPRTAPYVPFKTFQTAIEILQQVLPRKLDRSQLRTLSGTAQNETLRAFRFLNLIDDQGYVQPSLRRLVDERDNRKTALREILEQAYPEIVQLGKDHGSVAELREEISRYNVQGETARKAMSFFLKAAEFAELDVSPAWATVTRNVGTNSRSRARAKPAPRAPKSATEPPERKSRETKNQSVPGTPHQVKLAGGGVVALSVEADWVMVTPYDREWIMKLVDTFNSYGMSQDDMNGTLDEDEDDIVLDEVDYDVLEPPGALPFQ